MTRQTHFHSQDLGAKCLVRSAARDVDPGFVALNKTGFFQVSS